jgi:hypothetical protein
MIMTRQSIVQLFRAMLTGPFWRAAAMAAGMLLLPSVSRASETGFSLVMPVNGGSYYYNSKDSDIIFTASVNWADYMDNNWASAPFVRLTITCEGGSGSVVREPKNVSKKSYMMIEMIPAADLLALAPQGTIARPHRMHVQIEAGRHGFARQSGEGYGSLTTEFTLLPPANLAVSFDGDVGSPWPKGVVVKNVGSLKSQSSSVEVTYRLKDASDSSAAEKYCPKVDYHKVHTVTPIDPTDKKYFDLPKPGGFPKSAPAGQHKMMTCNYVVFADLANDTNKGDPVKRNNHQGKVVSIDIPLE